MERHNLLPLRKNLNLRLFHCVLLGFLCNLCTVKAQVDSTTEKYCDWPTHISKPTKWKAKDIPNPREDVCLCGRYGKKSWVCDPSNVITTGEADSIDAEIERLKNGTGPCHCGTKCVKRPSHYGVQAAVVFLQAMYISGRSSASAKKKTADDITDHLRDDEWEFGLCNDDLVILVSDGDRFIYTAVGDNIAHNLTKSCVDMIYENNKPLLAKKQYAEAVKNMLREYEQALIVEHPCNKPKETTKTSLAATLGVIGGLIAAVIGGCFLKRKCCPDACKNEGGSSDKAVKYKSTHDSHSRRSSASSQSSVGGGGGF